MATDGAALAAAAGPPLFTNVIFHHVPNALAPALLAALVVTSACFGVILLDLIANFAHDVRMVRKSGWFEIRKAGNRLAYLIARLGAFVYLTINIVYLTVPRLDCAPFAQALGAVWLVVMLAADGLFVMRVAAVYGWRPFAAVPLCIFYLAYAAVCAASVHDYGFGIQIPQSDFCAFVLKPHSNLFTACIIMGVVLDMLVLVLVTHRLTDGGLLNIFYILRTDKVTLARRRAERKAIGEAVGEVSIAGLLLKQGVGYFVVLVAARFAFMTAYYVQAHDAAIQLLVTSLLACIAPVLAGSMFRQVHGFFRNRTASNSPCNSNDTDDTHRRDGSASRGSSRMRLPISIKSMMPSRALTTTRSIDEACSEKSPRSATSELQSNQLPMMAYNVPATLPNDHGGRRSGSDGRSALQICVDETVDIEACTIRGP